MANDPDIPKRALNTSDVAEQPADKRGFARRNWGKLLVFLLIGGPIVVLTIWSAAAMAYTYSSGDRVGYVQKLGKRGWLCKTWEGELQMSNIPGSAPAIFDFTVRDDSVAAQIQAAEGRQVSLSYDQHVGVPLSCFGDTQYFISGVRVVNPQPGYSAPAPAIPPTPPPTIPPPAPKS